MSRLTIKPSIDQKNLTEQETREIKEFVKVISEHIAFSKGLKKHIASIEISKYSDFSIQSILGALKKSLYKSLICYSFTDNGIRLYIEI